MTAANMRCRLQLPIVKCSGPWRETQALVSVLTVDLRPDVVSSGSGTGLLEAPAAIPRAGMRTGESGRWMDVSFSQAALFFVRQVLFLWREWCHTIVIDV